jgi:hypothetical protein
LRHPILGLKKLKISSIEELGTAEQRVLLWLGVHLSDAGGGSRAIVGAASGEAVSSPLHEPKE